MRLGIIMSTYKDAKYLRKCIDSVLGQTFQDFKFFITNDVSPDDTQEIIKSYEDDRIRLITNTVNKNLSPNLNMMIKLIQSEYPLIDYIARQDSDDWSSLDRLEKQVYFLDSYKDYIMVGTNYLIANENGDIIGKCDCLTEDDDIRRDFYFQNWFCHGSMIFRAKALYEIGGYDENFIESQDYEIYMRLMQLGKVANLKEYLYTWRNIRTDIRKLAVQVYAINLARYKGYCQMVNYPFNIKNYRRTEWR